jgi:hypothetical protein
MIVSGKFSLENRKLFSLQQLAPLDLELCPILQ